MLNTRLFSAKEYPLKIYNGQAIVNKAFRFYTVVSCDEIAYEEIDYDFPGYTSAYFRIYNERNGRLIVEVTPTQSGPYLIVNASTLDMTFEDTGNYYYEIGYVSGVYEQALRYGTLTIL